MTKAARLLVPALWLIASVSSAQTESPFPRIRSIVIDHQPVFAPDERLDEIPLLPDLTFIFDLANLLHIDTKEKVIRRELLLKEGDPADPLLIAESERNLRGLPYVRQVKIVTAPASPGEVDLRVLAQDTWTTQPRAGFRFGGGTSRASFGIVESNVLGYGKRIRLLYRKGLDRSSSLFEYGDPRILGSRFAASGTYQNTSDGRVVDANFEYPFFSFETPWAGGTAYSGVRENQRLFDHFGDESLRVRHKGEVFDATIAHRLESSTAEVVDRIGLLYHRDEDTFHGAADTDPTLVPIDRRQSAPAILFHREVVHFVQEKHFEVFDRVEDFNLGNIFEGTFGYSWRALDALVDEPIVRVVDRQGFDLGPGRKLFLYGQFAGRYHDGDLRNAVLDLEGLSYYRVNFLYEHTLVTRLKLDLARNLDRDAQIFLGNDNGLRGFDTRQFAGEKRFIFNLEDRIFFVNDLFHLVSLGMVVFFDSGYVWDRNQTVDFRRLATSAGIGLRVDALRGAGEALFRLDLAVPITSGGTGRSSPGVTVGNQQAFGPFAGPFDLQTTSSP